MRVTLRTLAATAAILAAAACSDSTVAPRSESATLRASDRAPSLDLSFGSSINLGSDFTLTSNGGTFNIAGIYTVSFPQNSVCDPALTSYTATDDCVTLGQGKTKSIKVHGTVKLSLDGIAVDFQPELRFAPSKTVTLWTDIYAPVLVRNRDYYLAHPAALGSLAMAYSATMGGTRIADYASDASVVTHVNLTTGRVWRRVKHFSGYNIFTGDNCSPSPDNPYCVQINTQLTDEMQ
jgi:hypothetical protein